MADDRLDDAIDAVVRAVDRIERATRRQATVGDAPSAAPTDDTLGAGLLIESELDDLRPPVRNVAPGRDAWQPVTGGAGDGDDDRPRKSGKPKKKKHGHHPSAALPHAEAPAPAAAAAEPISPPPTPSGHTHAEVLELVGRIVARTQELDDHLEAARSLRSEITELVARLAAASTHQR